MDSVHEPALTFLAYVVVNTPDTVYVLTGCIDGVTEAVYVIPVGR